MPLLVRLKWKMTWIALLLLMSSAGAWDQSDASSVIRRSVAANNVDWSATPTFNYSERDQENGQTNTYEDTTILGSLASGWSLCFAAVSWWQLRFTA